VKTRGQNDDTFREEAAALGERAKGAAKDLAGHVIGDDEMEAEGERENARGRARQAANNLVDETDGVPGRTVTPGGYVTGLYSSPEAASRAYEGLTTKHGYQPNDINVVMSDDTRRRHFGDVTPGTELSGGTKAAEGLGKGAAEPPLAAASAPRWPRSSPSAPPWRSPGSAWWWPVPSPQRWPVRAPAAPLAA
jgi:uncharacterized protein YjbJ (UPF0337 family)